MYSGDEQSEIPVPMEALLRGNRLDIYPEVRNRNFFRLHLKDDRIVFQAAGFLGFIPLNDTLAIEVRSRVPIANLEGILLTVPRYAPEVLEHHEGDFGFAESPTPSLIDLLAIRLLRAIDAIRSEGLHYEYKNRADRGLMPRGRIMPFESVSWRAKTGNQFSVTYSAFERTQDTAPNQCLRTALRNLRDTYRVMKGRSGARSIAGKLGRAEVQFESAELDRTLRFLKHPSIVDPTRQPSTRKAYFPAIVVAKAILLNQGINIRTRGKDIILPCILINMEEVFEAYLRAILERGLSTNGLAVLDGNLREPSGAARPLFDRPDTAVEGIPACPDIVIRSSSASPIADLVIDAKYKPPGTKPDREDIKQVLVYSLVYGCRRVALAYPRRKPTEPIMHRIGSVGGTELFELLVDLNTNDLPHEETKVLNAVRALVSGTKSATPPPRPS